MELISVEQMKKCLTEEKGRKPQPYQDAIIKLAKEYGSFEVDEQTMLDIYRTCQQVESTLRSQFAPTASGLEKKSS
jgi:hypothetical protein